MASPIASSSRPVTLYNEVKDGEERMLTKIMSTPYLPWTTSAVLLAGVPYCVRSPIGFPQLVQLPFFSLIFGGSGYMIHAGDPLNGSGTTTAWSLMYLFFHGKRALISRRPAPILLAGTVAAQAAIAGSYYFTDDTDEDDERIKGRKEPVT